jgi:hypothetical protein
MISIKNSLVGLVLVGILGIVSTPVAFAHGGGGGGHGGGFGGGGHAGSFGGSSGHFGGMVNHSFTPHERESLAPHHSYAGHYRYRGTYSYGDPYWYDYPYYGYYDYDYDDGDDSDPQTLPSEGAPSESTTIAVQQKLAKLGFYHGQLDGLVGPGTQKAISWFQSVEKLAITGRIDDPTLNALQLR